MPQEHQIWEVIDFVFMIVVGIWFLGWFGMMVYSKLRSNYREYILELPSKDDDADEYLDEEENNDKPL